MISIITNINPDMSTKEAAEDTYFLFETFNGTVYA